jgi:DNA-binding response OmpR family regulator
MSLVMANPHAPRVLVIDDDAGVREAVSYLLAAFGYDCQTATDGRSGLVRFDEESWDLVITDLVMPQVSGWAVIEAIRHRAPTMPIVLLTALHDPTVIQRAREWRVPVLAKPFRLETLEATVVAALYATIGHE